MMFLCNDKHEEVCYEARYCPVCEKNAEVDRLQLECEKLREEIEDLK